MNSTNQFQLLKLKRFGPFFLTQFLGAFNDNVYKNALIILVAFQSVYAGTDKSHTIINLAAALFILPFFLFSATAGQIADRYEKSNLIRKIKFAEIIIMLIATAGFFLNNFSILLSALFLMGAQSAFFGPIKYGILPQYLKDHELIGGNALVESGTFIAILAGTMLGGLLTGLKANVYFVSGAILAIAALGYVCSLFIPSAPSVEPQLKINLNPFTETYRTFRFMRKSRTVFLSVLGIAWFWFLGTVYITQLPNFTHTILKGNEQVVTLLLTTFCIGIGVGSLLCERLSGRTVELGLVPFGSIGLTIFGIDLFLGVQQASPETPRNAFFFLSNIQNWRLIIDILFLGTFGGFYIVPLYALIQQRSDPAHRSRIIAGNNIIGAFLMVCAALFSIFILKLGFSIPHLFLFVAILNIGVSIYIYTLIPEFLMRFLVWILVHLVYRVDKQGLENIPEKGAAVLVCNHVSLMDALVIGGCVRRPVRFVMYYKIFELPILRFIFKTTNAIPIAPQREDSQMLETAYEKIASELKNGNLICIFPEGNLTTTGEIDTFRPGIELIIKHTPVTVIPMALRGLWGSLFSKNRNANIITSRPTKIWRKIGLIAGPPIAPSDVSANHLQNIVVALRGEWK